MLEQTRKAIKAFDEKAKNWTQQQARDYLVKLGTHRPDGSLHPNYGGKE